MTHIDMAHMTQVTVIAQGEWDMVKHAEPSNKFKTFQPKHQPDNSRKTSNNQESSR
jgi:molybdenum cofactor biosynthesis enzyme